MAIITFWNDGKKETGQTASIAAIATGLSVENNYKTLMFNTKHNDKTIEDCFWNTIDESTMLNFKEEGKTDIDTGITGLCKAVSSNKASPEKITHYAKTIFKGRLELLTDSSSNEEEYLNQRKLFKDIIRVASQYYSLVFVDLEGDLEEEGVADILKISTVIVPTLNQTLRSLSKFVQLKQENPILDGLKIMPLLGRYDRKSKYTAKNVARYTKTRQAYGIPYNTLLFESLHEGKTDDYFIKFKKAKPQDSNGMVVDSVRTFTTNLQELLKMLQMNI
ncbi:MAG: hypothetical protein FWC68_00370 [Oscillospiraceae bacterium]|nr:hypothetical protein [Oscillospiraceae bacterium]